MDQFEVPADLKDSGNALWCGVSAGRILNAANMVLLLNACRIADRLDEISEKLLDEPLTVTIYDQRGNPVNEVAQPLLGEHRQQFATLNTILARMGLGELAKIKVGKATVEDQMAAKRRERAARDKAAG